MRISSKGMGRRRWSATLVAGVAIAALGLGAAPAQAAKPAKPPKAAKGGPQFSKEFAATAQPIQIKLEAARVAKAKVDAKDPAGKAELDAALAGSAALLAAAEAAVQSPDDRLVAGQFAVSLGGYLADVPMRQRGARNMIDSGKLDPAKVPEFQYYLGNFAYANKDYATAQSALAAAVAGGYPADDAVELLADSYARTQNPQGALAEIRKAVDARRAAGKPVPSGWLKRANLIAYNGKLGPEAIYWAITQVELQPNNFNWLGSAQLIRQFSGYGPQETLDLFRLMMRSGAFDADPKYLANEFKEYIEAADPRRLPGEVLAAIQKGTASGAINGSAAWVADARNIATGRAANDKASLASQANSARTGADIASVADAYLNYGEAAKAEELYTQALAKGAADRDRVLTRLGIAQTDQGKWAAARDNFAKVGGTRTNLAKLWLLYIAQKGGAAPVTG